jgi:hypothetical protein
MEGARLVEMTNIDMHEKFLCRLVVNSYALPVLLLQLSNAPETELA